MEHTLLHTATAAAAHAKKIGADRAKGSDCPEIAGTSGAALKSL